MVVFNGIRNSAFGLVIFWIDSLALERKEEDRLTCFSLYFSSLSEWDVIEWSDDQAVFTFVYDTIELTITFGEPVGK